LKYIHSLVIVFYTVSFNFLMAKNFGDGDTLLLSRQQAESLFLDQNLLLVAEQLNIGKAEAMEMQARLWPNPRLEIEEVNLWATNRQLSLGETLPPIHNGFGSNQQISVQLEQLILTAGKRRKLMAIEEVSTHMAREYFEDLLRNLKVEFRNNLTDLQYLQQYRAAFTTQLDAVQSLVITYRNQAEQGNIGMGEYIRLKALELELLKELSDLNMEINQMQMELKVLMNLPAHTILLLEEDDFVPNVQNIRNIPLDQLLHMATERPDFRISRLGETYFSRIHEYERAQRVPDLSLIGGYDRGGNFLLNFIGFGVAMDLPVFNRNQGNIKFAQLGMERSRALVQEKETRVRSEVVRAYQNLIVALDLYEKIEPDYESTLDRLLENYTRHFSVRNISMLEFLDFMEAYLENKQIILGARRDMNRHFEELKFTVGNEIYDEENN
jgi:outer membrane protein, heavy metal efflux system